MTKALNIVAIFFIVVGVVGFLISIDDIKDAKETSEFWDKSASKYLDNSLISAQADDKALAYTNQIILSVVTLVSGVVVGVFFLALSKIISVLESIRDKKFDVIPQTNTTSSASFQTTP